jgi:hypothetical protein
MKPFSPTANLRLPHVHLIPVHPNARQVCRRFGLPLVYRRDLVSHSPKILLDHSLLFPCFSIETETKSIIPEHRLTGRTKR